jgi:hypothetical protein
MAHYIAYATEAGTKLPRKMKEQAVSMLIAGLWGVPSSAQLSAKLRPGDGLIIAVGSPHREFIGRDGPAPGLLAGARRTQPICLELQMTPARGHGTLQPDLRPAARA